MRRGGGRRVAALAFGALALLPVEAIARSPRTGDMALAFAAGASGTPDDGESEGEKVIALAYDLHWTAAWSVRGTLGSIEMQETPGSRLISAVYIAANVSRNWLRGPIYPFVTGGIGAYATEAARAGGGDDHALEGGLNGGAGFELRLTDALVVRLQGELHALSGDLPRPVAAATAAVKLYF